MTEETKKTPKTTSDMASTARATLESLRDIGYTREETTCILALANTIIQGEMIIKAMFDQATVVKVPMKMPVKIPAQKSKMN